MNTNENTDKNGHDSFTTICINDHDQENQQEINEQKDDNPTSHPIDQSTERLNNLLNNINKNSNSNSNECKDILCALFLLILCLGLIGGCICYYVFGIMYLVEDYDEAKDCKKSNLWAYVLVNLILSLKISQLKSKDDTDNSYTVLIFNCIIDAGMSIWGGIELFNNTCSDLEDTNLFTFALTIFIIQVIISAAVLIVLPLFTCLITIFDK